MTAHKHVEMITAKANNMDLAVFFRNDENWFILTGNALPSFEAEEYFLCLPQHKEACLHWLNGGEIQTTSLDGITWRNLHTRNNRWPDGSVFMTPIIKLRIKPKKEKRWIVYRHDGEILGPFDSYKFADGINSGQVIEIEVEHGR